MLCRLTRWSGSRVAWIASLLILFATSFLHAQTNIEETSLQIVPDDVGFYATMLRNREQWEIVKNSKAYAKLQQNAFVQLGIFQLRQLWANPQDDDLAQFKAEIEKPENQALIKLLREAAGQEIFLFGDSQFAKQLALFNRINNAQQMAQIQAATTGADPEEVMKEQITAILNENAGEIQIPVFVIGTRTADPQAATQQLQRLENAAKQFLSTEQPDLAERLKRMKVGQGDYLVLSLDGSQIPWDDIREDIGDDEQLNQLIEKLKQKTVSLAIGVHGSYIIVSVGPDTNHLARLGEGDKLADREEFAPIKQHLNERITSIGYASGDFIKQAANIEQQLEALGNIARAALPAAELDEASEQKVINVIDNFLETAKNQLPQPGAVAGVAFLSERGIEEYSYDWTENSQFDASKQLSILQHLGPRPILFFAGRSVHRPEQYDESAKLFKELYEVGNEIALQKLDEAEKAEYEKVRDKLLPLFGRLDTVIREKFSPAFADSQSAFVLDADLTSRQLQSMIPESNVDLPVPELAIVCGVSDAELARQGGQELFRIVQEAINAVREVAPEEVPPIELPSPMVEDADVGQIYSYALPEQWGIDKQVAPNAGLSEDTLVLSLAPATSKRLLGESPVLKEGVLAEADGKPLAAAVFFDFAGLIDLAVPWARYGVAVSQDTDVESVVLPGQDIIEVLKCFQNVTSIAYKDGDKWVTHSEYYFRDLEE